MMRANPHRLRKAASAGRGVAHLRRGVQLRTEVHPQVSHVLHDQGIDARGEQLAGLPLGLLQFVVEQKRVEGRMHPHAEAVSVLRHAAICSVLLPAACRAPNFAPPM